MSTTSETSVNRRSAAVLPDSARLSAVRNINTDCMCSHVIFIVFFKFCLENADGDGFIAHTSALEMTQLLNVLITNNIWYCQNKLSAAVWVINEYPLMVMFQSIFYEYPIVLIYNLSV